MSHVQTGIGLDLSVYTDSNYAEKADDRRSASGVVVTLGNATVGWICSKQRIVTLSTTEVDYVALGDGVKQALFAKSVASFLVPSLSQKTIMIFVDIDGAIKLVSNPLSSARTKHIDVRFQFVRELVSSGIIAVEYVPTNEQRTDIVTKAFVGPIFRELRDFLMNLHD